MGQDLIQNYVHKNKLNLVRTRSICKWNKNWKGGIIRDTCKHKIKCTEKWYILYKCKNHIIMEFIMQNNIQSKQLVCHPESRSEFGLLGKRIASYNLYLILSNNIDKYSHLTLTISLRWTDLINGGCNSPRV